MLYYTLLDMYQQCKNAHVVFGIAAYAGTVPYTNDIVLGFIMIAQLLHTDLATDATSCLRGCRRPQHIYQYETDVEIFTLRISLEDSPFFFFDI